jgi:hypothetical protein
MEPIIKVTPDFVFQVAGTQAVELAALRVENAQLKDSLAEADQRIARVEQQLLELTKDKKGAPPKRLDS